MTASLGEILLAHAAQGLLFLFEMLSGPRGGSVMRQRLQESEVTHQDWEARQFRDAKICICLCVRPKKIRKHLAASSTVHFAERGCSANVHGLLEHKT